MTRLDDAVRFSHRAGDEREINLFHRSLRELSREALMSYIIFRDDQTAARFFVEPMNNSGSLLSADAGKCAAMRE